MELVERVYPYLQEDWMIFFLVGVLMLLAIIRYNYPKRIIQLFQAVLRARMLRQMMREELVLSHRASLALLLIFSANSALVVYLAAKYYRWVPYLELKQWFFGVIFIAVLLMYLWKLISVRVFQFFFEVDAGLSEYLVFSLVLNMLLGIVWMPIILVAIVALPEVVKILLSIAFGMFLMTYAMRLLRGVFIAKEHHVFSVYIILYLCALEILPFAVLAKGIAEGKF